MATDWAWAERVRLGITRKKMVFGFFDGVLQGTRRPGKAVRRTWTTGGDSGSVTWGGSQRPCHHNIAARWPEHAPMGRHGLLASEPYHLKHFPKFQNQYKFWNSKQRSSPCPKILKIFKSIAWNIRNNFTFQTNFKFPQDCMLQILEQIQIWIFLEF
jgi:hypothetical protein